MCGQLTAESSEGVWRGVGGSWGLPMGMPASCANVCGTQLLTCRPGGSCHGSLCLAGGKARGGVAGRAAAAAGSSVPGVWGPGAVTPSDEVPGAGRLHGVIYRRGALGFNFSFLLIQALAPEENSLGWLRDRFSLPH